MSSARNTTKVTSQINTKQATQKQKYNTLAIVAIITSMPFISFGIFGFIPVICGIISLVQIKKSGQRGKWLAIIAIIAGAVELIYITLFLISVHQHPDELF